MATAFKAVYDYSDPNPVVHWRTKGSKNGVRLYQNPDGSYTELGRESKPGGRYNSRYDADKSRLSELKSKGRRITNDELSERDDLTKAINRTNRRAKGTGLYHEHKVEQHGKNLRQMYVSPIDLVRVASDVFNDKMDLGDAWDVFLSRRLQQCLLSLGLTTGVAVLAKASPAFQEILNMAYATSGYGFY